MRKASIIGPLLMATAAFTAAAAVWASNVPPEPLSAPVSHSPAQPEKIAPYRSRFGRTRPLVTIVGANGGTELTDFVIPYGVLARSGVADIVTVSTTSGVMTMRPALHLRPDSTIDQFDKEFEEGADYVIVPAVVDAEDPRLLRWLRQQANKGATIISICDGAEVVANTGLMRGHRATAHWASLGHRREHHPEVTWVENSRYVADRKIVSSAGISAAIPTSLALVEAIAGRDKAAAVSSEIGADDWSNGHNSEVFALTLPRNLAAMLTTHLINPVLRGHEPVGLGVSEGIDEVALAVTADAYSRTGQSTAYLFAPLRRPVLTLHGLRIVPDRASSDTSRPGRVVQLAPVKPARQLDVALDAIARDYGRLTAFGVALEFEYPGFK